MSFKSLKEFGVSAERLGSMCKRWMSRVQRFVLCASYAEMYVENLLYPQTFVLHVSVLVLPDLDAFALKIWIGRFNYNDRGASSC